VGAQHAKQLLKNAAYRAIGETTGFLGADPRTERALTVLMYHKVNDLEDNPTTVPVSLFDEQMDELGSLGYTVVGLDAVLDFYVEGKPLPPRAVLISFDDGYRDTLTNAVPVLRKYDYEAVLFLPLAYLDDPMPLPHEKRLSAQGIHNPTLHADELAELEAGGVRIESHGISHRPLAELEVDEAVREIAVSKLKLEERLGRPVRSFAYVKGSDAHFHSVHVSFLRQAGYDLAFTSVSGANGPNADPLRLKRYNVEPYPARTFELVLAGACDLIAVKDTVAGTHARRVFNAALGTATEQ
jgi:peptidoglycan/xylan/chitin deacetylase (PgdA/CDA1 family)